ncbi:SOS response-associated peptidase [Photobacterium sagamiensis]|uniref:SOS response-associated peptidase n=1 Tax=Photobacterium sagamiensis TaxID=2910241 RepID=UPI003D14825A
MCGRFSVLGDMLSKMVSEEVGISFEAEENNDLRPTQTVATIISDGSTLRQQNTQWGIQPEWAKRLIINAQAETAAEKKTFRQAMQTHRCLVPCSGWYEWRDEGGQRKQKYLFSHATNKPLYMAGIWFPSETPHMVTLTTEPNAIYLPYHNRMPVLIPADTIKLWLEGELTALAPLMMPNDTTPIAVTVAE